MTELEHLQVYDLVLTTLAPLYVGSGQRYTKKEYLYRAQSSEVSFLDRQKFFDFLARRNLVDAYEQFMLGPDSNLYLFLTKDCGLLWSEIEPFIRCRVFAADALDGEHSLKEILAFQRDAWGRVFVPGSSVKGALRTAWLLNEILETKDGPHWLPDGTSGRNAISFPEEKYINRLRLDEKNPKSAVNSLFRGIMISDSGAIPDTSLMLADKLDAMPDGGTHSLNLCRECAAPGTKLRFRLTLDQSVLQGRISAGSLLQAVSRFDEYYRRTYLSAFTPPPGTQAMPHTPYLVLGGGSGFFAKSLAYPYLGREEGLTWTARQMKRMFPNRGKRNPHHEKDQREYGISPHTMKYTRYRQKLYHFGLCEVAIL